FFFSSRRRHTRSKRDWSSDVCSSDLKRAATDEGDRKIGLIWHTQGSGKSLSMVFFTGKLVLEMNNPTVVVLTDRNDLDDQLYNRSEERRVGKECIAWRAW